MIHFDAHPDLACPAIPAAAVFTPRHPVAPHQSDLYELLDSRASGISEWILPLVLAAQLEEIEWIKPDFSTQLPPGRHVFHVGANDSNWKSNGKPTHFVDLGPHAQLKVDWNHPYYLEDDSAVPSKDLALSQALKLHVTELSEENPALSFKNVIAENSEYWVLDICLDYFSCCNPYLSDIDNIDSALTKAFLSVVSTSSINRATLDTDILEKIEPTAYTGQIQDFQTGLRKALEATSEVEFLHAARLLSMYYSSNEVCQQLLLTLRELILLYGETAREAVIEAIPFWHMPHATSSSKDAVIDESMRRVRQSLEGFFHDPASPHPPPFLITIARSTDDGFAPASVVERLQSQVLGMLQEIFHPCYEYQGESYAIRVTRDYGEWEGSTIPLS